MSTTSAILDSSKQSTSTSSAAAAASSVNPFSHFLGNISSYDGNVLLAAVMSLLIVILFVLLLHLYARWFLAQARQQRRRPTVSRVLRPDRFRHFHAFNFDSNFPISASKGLDSSVISSIPLFVYKSGESKIGLECVICLSPFDENDVGRQLPKCSHAFHVECIDTWLRSHSNCPICRAPLALAAENKASVEIGSVERREIDGESPVMGAIDEESGNTNRDGSVTPASPSSSSSSSLGCSLRRMLSRTRSEHKVFPASDAVESNVLDLTV